MKLSFGPLANTTALISFTNRNSCLFVWTIGTWVDNQAEIDIGDVFQAVKGDWFVFANLMESFQRLAADPTASSRLAQSSPELDAVFAHLRHWMADEIERLMPGFEARTGTAEPLKSLVSEARRFRGTIHDPCTSSLAPDCHRICNISRPGSFPGTSQDAGARTSIQPNSHTGSHAGAHTGTRGESYDPVSYWRAAYRLDPANPIDSACIALLMAARHLHDQHLHDFPLEIRRASEGFGYSEGCDIERIFSQSLETV